jgi:hypothetical protein
MMSSWRLIRVPPASADALSAALQAAFGELSEAADRLPLDVEVGMDLTNAGKPRNRRQQLVLLRYVLAPRKVVPVADTADYVVVVTREGVGPGETELPAGVWRPVGTYAERFLLLRRIAR